ncbi:MAG TPA: hypothetical protein VI756_22795 [Blastocatellia bacterium]
MRKWSVCIAVVLLALASACEDKPKPPAGPPAPKDDPKIAQIKAEIAKTTPDEKAQLDKCLAMKPEVNGKQSAMTLNEVVNDYATNKGDYDIHVIGWEAHFLSNKKWKISLNYQDFSKNLTKAEWWYDPDTNKLYPFETKYAPVFWSPTPANANANNAKGK